MSRARREQQDWPDQLVTQRWVEQELSGCTFKDKRLERRLRTLLAQMASKPGGSILLACQDWAGTKAAYRFFDNAKVDEAEILEGHFRATLDRMPPGTEPRHAAARRHEVHMSAMQHILPGLRRSPALLASSRHVPVQDDRGLALVASDEPSEVLEPGECQATPTSTN